MHELPSDLQHSLRSFRGSLRLSREEDTASHFDTLHHLEHQAQPVKSASIVSGAHAVDNSPSTHSQHGERSIILHPTASSGNIRARPLTEQPPVPNTYTSASLVQQQPRPPNTSTLANHTLQLSSTANQAPQEDNNGPATAPLAKSSIPLKPDELYELLGMVKPDPKTHLPPKDWETYHGFYRLVRHRERSVGQRYRFYDIFVSGLLVVQLLLSAVFIVLGSVNSIHHITIVVLGAISTLVAGILALVKGQGLPTRLRMERDGLRDVLQQAKELYWNADANIPVTFGEVEKVRDAYHKVVNDAAKNHPDMWNASSEKTPPSLVPTGAVGGNLLPPSKKS
ncbi:hypothetical protein MBLNU457_1662t1 [Dothideomycetes sp. NU457]